MCVFKYMELATQPIDKYHRQTRRLAICCEYNINRERRNTLDTPLHVYLLRKALVD